jgi:histidine triad (HIT) family protein
MVKLSLLNNWIARLMRSPFGRRITAWTFIHMNPVLPGQRLYQSQTVYAIFHPSPAYPLHILIIPKKPITSLEQLNENDNVLVMEIIQVAQQLIERFHLQENGYRLIVNGGRYQEIPQLHFHLISDINPQQNLKGRLA